MILAFAPSLVALVLTTYKDIQMKIDDETPFPIAFEATLGVVFAASIVIPFILPFILLFLKAFIF